MFSSYFQSPKRQYRRKKVKPKLNKPVPAATAIPSTSMTAATPSTVKNVPLSSKDIICVE